MQLLHFEIVIDAPREKVWHAMLDQEGFRQWTAAFAEGSYFEGSWDKGAKIKFLTPGGEGMTSTIADNRPFEFLSIKHLGIIKDGVEDMQSPESRSWSPALENYVFTERDGATEVKVELEVPPDHEAFMNEAWPQALARLKQMCERQH